MLFPCRHRKSAMRRSFPGPSTSAWERTQLRKQRGAVLPMVVFGLMGTIAILALTADLMRLIHAVSTLQFASESAALSGYSYVCDEFGKYSSPNEARPRISDRVKNSAWNVSPAGPEGTKSKTQVSFQDNDVNLFANPDGNSTDDLFLQVTASRQGADAIKLFFMPAIFAFNSWSGLPQPPDVNFAKPYRVTEVIAQPASRIGSGAIPNGNDPQSSALAGFATFPLMAGLNGLNQVGFFSNGGLGNFTVAVEQSDKKTVYNPTDVRGAFVNVAAAAGTVNYYGSTSSAQDAQDLLSTLQYFQPSIRNNSIPPAVIERGSKVSAFDASQIGNLGVSKDRLIVELRKLQTLSQSESIPPFIVPVSSSNPSLQSGWSNQVLGFAWMRLVGVQSATETDPIRLIFTASTNIGQGRIHSIAIRNASCANGEAAVKQPGTGEFMSDRKPIWPFVARDYNASSNSVAAVNHYGVVMAPSLSPRTITPL